MSDEKYYSLKPVHFIIFSILFAFIVNIIDAIIDDIFFFHYDFYSLLFPPIGTHFFYEKVMLFFTYLAFGILVYLMNKRQYNIHKILLKSELRFKTIVNYTKNWEYWIAPNKNINFISPSCKEITGYCDQEFYDNPSLLDTIIFPQDKKLFQEHETEALTGKDMNSLEFRIITKENNIKWIDHNCQSVYNSQGQYIGHRVSNRDITKRKIFERELKKLSDELISNNEYLEKKVESRTKEVNDIISQSPYPKAICNKDGNIIQTNDAWLKLFKSNKPFTNILDSNHTEDKEIIHLISKVLKKGGNYKSKSVYFEELDKMMVLSVYDVKNINGNINKVIINYEDVTDHMHRIETENELKMQKIISKSMFDFLESERKRVSKELHDQIGQKLMLTKLNLEIINSKEPNFVNTDEIIKLVVNINKDIKDIVYSLHPAELENYGLVEALKSMIRRCSKAADFKPTINIFGKYVPLKKETELEIYRIIQEIVNNICKHSKAKEANFELHFSEDSFSGIISDNGKGFDFKKYEKNFNKLKSYGLISIRERVKILGGSLEINSKIGLGTKVYIEIPLNYNEN